MTARFCGYCGGTLSEFEGQKYCPDCTVFGTTERGLEQLVRDVLDLSTWQETRSEGRLLWTTASEAYDLAGTGTVSVCVAIDEEGRPVRCVSTAPERWADQREIYDRGLHATWDAEQWRAYCEALTRAVAEGRV